VRVCVCRSHSKVDSDDVHLNSNMHPGYFLVLLLSDFSCE